MRFVRIKSEEQQAVLVMHRARDLLVRQRERNQERRPEPSFAADPKTRSSFWTVLPTAS
jgi:hypothetical protein